MQNEWKSLLTSYPPGEFEVLYQLERQKAPAEAKVLVCEGRFGRITIEYRGRELRFAEIAAPAQPKIGPMKRSQEQQRARRAAVRRAAAADPPWKQAAREGAARKALREAGLLAAATLIRPSASS